MAAESYFGIGDGTLKDIIIFVTSLLLPVVPSGRKAAKETALLYQIIWSSHATAENTIMNSKFQFASTKTFKGVYPNTSNQLHSALVLHQSKPLE